MSNDSWRRATAAPFGSRAHGHSPEPPAYSAPQTRGTGSRHHLDAALEFENARLRTKLDQMAREEEAKSRDVQRDRLQAEASVARERSAASTAEEDLRRMAAHLRTVEGENSQLRHTIAELEAKLALESTRAENSVANAKLADADNILRQHHEIEKLLSDVTFHKNEQDRLERVAEDLRAELRSSSTTIATQNESIRGLTSQMSRLDPYHLIKQHREQTDAHQDAAQDLQRELIDKIEALTKQNASLTVEARGALAAREAAIKELEEAKRSTTELSRQAEDGAETRRRVQALEKEKLDLKAQLLEAESAAAELEKRGAQYDRDRGDVELQLKAKVRRLEDELKHLKQKNADDLAAFERDMQDAEQKYSAKILQLRRDREVQEQQTEQMRKKMRNAEAQRLAEQEDHEEAVQKMRMKAKSRELDFNAQVQQLQAETEATKKAQARTLQGASVSREAELAMEAEAAKVGDAPIDAKIRVVNCRGLLDRDKKGKDVSDPYVKIVGPQKASFTTKTVDDNLDPDFPADTSTMDLRLSSSMPGHIRVQVFDYNWGPMRDTFLGETTIPIGSLFFQGPGARTEALRPRENESEKEILENAHKLGTVTIEIEGLPAADPAKRKADIAKRKRENTVAPPDNVTLTIVRCQGLIDRDSGDKDSSDPFVKVLDLAGKEILKTETQKDTLDPEFDAASSTAEIKLSKGMPGGVTLRVMDEDMMMHHFLGEIIVPVADIYAYGPGPRRLRLQPRAEESEEDIFEAANELGMIEVLVGGVPVVPKDKMPKPPAYAFRDVGKQRKVRQHERDVTFMVVSAQGLINRDGDKDHCDPYVTVFSPQGDEVLETPAVKDTESPNWEALGRKARCKMTMSAVTPGYVKFHVWEDDLIGDDFLGEARLAVKTIFEKGDATHAIPLRPRQPKEKDKFITENAHQLGALTVRVSGITGKGETEAIVSTGPSKDEVAAAQKADVKLPKVVATKVGVRVVKCNDLVDVEAGTMWGKSDSYVKVLDPFNKQVFVTPVKDDCLDPAWEKDEASGTVELTPETRGALDFTVWDSDKVGDSVLGTVRVPVKDLFAMGFGERVLRLGPAAGNMEEKIAERLETSDSLGTVTVVFSGLPAVEKPKLPKYVVDPKAPLAAAKSPKATQVTIKITKANGLLEYSSWSESGTSDPFVLIKAGPGGGKEVHKTGVKDDDLDPVWGDDAAQVTVPIVKTSSVGVRLEMWNHNTVGSNDFMGECVLNPQTLFDRLGAGTHTMPLNARTGEKVKHVFENAHKLGKITFTLSGLPKVPAPAKPPAARAPNGGKADAAVPAAKPGEAKPVPYDVDFFVAACHGLLNRESNTSDPLVKVKDPRGEKVLQTKEVDGNLNPTWEKDQATARIVLSSATPGFVSFEVWDHNSFSNDFMGYAQITVKELFNAGKTKYVIRLSPRPKESDSKILEEANNLGSITIFVAGLPVKPAAPKPAADAAPAAAAAAAAPDAAPAATAASKPKSGTADAAAPAGAAASQPAAAASAAPAAAQPEAKKPEAAAPPPPPPKVPKEAKVSVYVASCKGLMNRDGGWVSKESDPYVIVVDPEGKDVGKTSEVDDNLNPEWNVENGTVKFVVPHSAVKGKQGANVLLQVWDKDTGKGDILGEVRVDANGLFTASAESVGTFTRNLVPSIAVKDAEVEKAKSLGSMTFTVKSDVTYE